MRKTFDSKFKVRVVLEAIKEEKAIVEIANQYENIFLNEYRNLKKLYREKHAVQNFKI